MLIGKKPVYFFEWKEILQLQFPLCCCTGTPFEDANAPGRSYFVLFDSHYSQILILRINPIGILVDGPQWSDSAAGGNSIWSFMFLIVAVRCSKDEQFAYSSSSFL